MENCINIEQSDITFETIRDKEYYPIELDEQIKQSNVLLIPFENFREGYKILFPEITRELYYYLKDNETENLKIEVVANEETFKEIELHDAATIITSILFSSVSSIVLGLLTNFLYDKIKTIGKKPQEVIAKIDVYYEKTKTKKTVKISYEGSVDEMKHSIEKVIKDIEND